MADRHRIFVLCGKEREHFKNWKTILSPVKEDIQSVRTEWSYAIRYTAKGLDIPDDEAALKWILERHPDWEVIPEGIYNSIHYDARTADSYNPDET